MKNDNLKPKNNFKFLIAFFIFAFCIFHLSVANASEFTVTPVVVDEKAKARDIIKKTFTVTNTTERKLGIYPSVNNVSPDEGKQPFEQAHNSEDLTDSLANWIEISRGVIDLEPGETREVPFIIRINLNTLPGIYHAQISFGEGSTRAKAEEDEGKQITMVNLEVLEDIKEEMQLGSFFTDRIFFSGDDVLFRYQLENIGNKDVTPKGEIRIYNRKGEEVAVIDANEESKIFAPDKISQLASVWNAGGGFGRYKAFLDLDYGSTQRGSLQDTAFFWVIPWKTLAGIFFGCLFAVIAFASIFHRWLERRRMPAFAPIGVEASMTFTAEKTARAYNNIVVPPTTEVILPEKERSKSRFFGGFFGGLSAFDEQEGQGEQENQGAPASEKINNIAWKIPKENSDKDKKVDLTVPTRNHDHPFLQKVYKENQMKQAEKTAKVPAKQDYTSGGTINLKKLSENKKEKLAENSHVIDLRK